MVKFTQSVDVARETFAQAGQDSEFDFSEDFLTDLLAIAWSHKGDSFPRREAISEISASVKKEAARRRDSNGD